MNVEDLEPNTVSLVISLDTEGNPITQSFAKFEEDFDVEDENYLSFLLRGMSLMASLGPNAMAMFGSALAMADEFEEQEGAFEPADELLDILNDGKVVPINGKKHLN
jgi:hypothetical protein